LRNARKLPIFAGWPLRGAGLARAECDQVRYPSVSEWGPNERMRLSRALSVILIASAVSCAAGYSTSSPGGHERPGAIGVSLTLLGGQTLNSLTYNLANGTPADALMGTIPLPTGSASTGPYAVPTFEILPVAAATGYTITLSGTSTNGAVTCSGASSPPFEVTAGNETIVNVLVTCTTPNVSGSVEVNATLRTARRWPR
jgi:hypothetical protein